jgi:hypothetical protein
MANNVPMMWISGKNAARVPLLVSTLLVAACSGSAQEVSTGVPATVTTGAPSGSEVGEDTTAPTTSTDGTTDDEAGTTEGNQVTTSTEDPTGVIPDRYFAITNDTYELVEVETASGEIVARFGGWGQTSEDCTDDCYDQAIDSVDLGADGRLWMTDCCEPAAGNLYALNPGAVFDPDLSFGLGLSPTVSPDERLLAYTALEDIRVGPVGFSSADPSSRFPVVRHDDEPVRWYTPVAWLDDTTMVVRVNGDLVDNLILVDVSEWAEPVQIGPVIGGLVLHPDAAVRADGMIVALTRTPGEGDDPSAGFDNPTVSGQVFDPFSGELVSEFDLPDDVYSIDYDSTARFLLTAGGDGVVRWYGLGRSGEVGSGFVAATW